MVRAPVVLVCLVAVVGCTHSGLETRPALVTKSALRLAGGEVLVTLARFEAPGPPCLVEVRGARSSYDGRALPCFEERGAVSIQRNGLYPTLLTLAEDGTTGQVSLAEGPVLEVHAFAPPSVEEVGGLVSTWRGQERDGSLAAFQSFSRALYLQDGEAGLAEDAKAVEQRCGFPLEVSADWASVGTTLPDGCDVGCWCTVALEGIGLACNGAPAPVRRRIAQLVQKVHCRQRPEPGLGFELKSGALEVTFNEPPMVARSTTEFILQAGASPQASVAGMGPWHDGQTPGELRALDGFKVCRDTSGHLLVVDDAGDLGLFTGTLKALVQSRPVRDWSSSSSAWFADPRMSNQKSLPTFATEFPARMYSRITFDEALKTCRVTCGAREVKVPLLGKDEGQAVMLASRVVPASFTRAPHALLRDSTGTYYFVDTGAQPGHERDFHLYVGRKGSMVQQKMTNVVADTGGELYSTKRGDLQLLIDVDQASTWSARGKKTPLKTLNLKENLDVVFLELGVYTGQRLGTPCDDF